jgi:predicted ArsR family transcriptional regulator
VLHKRSCPFLRMVDEKRSICCVDLEMMTAIVGKPVRRTACRHDGSPCCTFEVAEEK